MKVSKILVALFAFCMLFSSVTFAKSKNAMDIKNQSVQLLMQLNEEGLAVRKNDEQMEKPDTQADTQRVELLKQKYEQERAEDFPNSRPGKK